MNAMVARLVPRLVLVPGEAAVLPVKSEAPVAVPVRVPVVVVEAVAEAVEEGLAVTGRVHTRSPARRTPYHRSTCKWLEGGLLGDEGILKRPSSRSFEDPMES